MTSRANEMTYPALELILDAVANWAKKHRDAAGPRDDVIPLSSVDAGT